MSEFHKRRLNKCASDAYVFTNIKPTDSDRNAFR